MTATKVLVIAAHPDDEVLGAGGTIASHTANGDDVHIFFLAEGVTARDPVCDLVARAGDIEAREDMARSAAKVLKAHPPRFARLPDNRMDGDMLIDIAKKIETVIAELEPQIIYTNHGGDLNVDHRLTHQAVLTAARPQPGSSVRAIYSFETPSSTDWGSAAMTTSFSPVRYVDIGQHLNAKLDAIACYDEEMRPFPHARSGQALEALARWRGAFVGLEAAEAFEVLRELA